ncbi:ankyrin repeat domain-containing protein [Legionella sp. D16C41]|uniref:ankyrin repeat domain-containing protein n=1 Tax=Legionella sp. D16C41 TaxID=3402688 RepID=UPI003AF606D4
MKQKFKKYIEKHLRTSHNRKTLTDAIEQGNLSLIKNHIEKGGHKETFVRETEDIYGSHIYISTPLLLTAVQYYQLPIIEYLLPLENEENKYKALKLAINNEALEITKLILSHGVLLKNQATLLAVKTGNIKLIELILSYGASLNEQHALAAIETGNIEVVELILKTKTNLILANEKETGLTLAASQPNDMLNFLFTQGFGRLLNLSDDKERTPLMLAAKAAIVPNIKLLLTQGADITLCDKKGNNALFYAAESGSLAAFKLLYQAEIAINITPKENKKLLNVALRNGHRAIIDFLLKEPANQTTLSTITAEKQNNIIPLCVANNGFFSNQATEKLNRVETVNSSSTYVPS